MRTSRRLLAMGAAAAALLPGALPAHAANGANVGSGTVTITANFNGSGLPLFNGGCASVSFNLVGGTATGVVANTMETTFEGQVPLSGGGSNACAFLDRELLGSVNLNAFFVHSGLTNSDFDCPLGLSGGYTRVGTHVQVDIASPVGGDCTINNFASGRVHFISDGEFAPTSGDGILNQVRSGQYAGAFAIAD